MLKQAALVNAFFHVQHRDLTPMVKGNKKRAELLSALFLFHPENVCKHCDADHVLSYDHKLCIYYKYDLFVIELATQEGNFIFRYCKNPGVPGRCDFCYTRGLMKS